MTVPQGQEKGSVAPGNGGNGTAAEHLGRVIDESLFAMHFQPIVDLRSQSVFAYEALCRPQDEYFKSPVDLISAAVEASRIGELGRLQRAAALEGGGDAVLFLNLEPHEFDEPWLVRPDDPIFKHRHPVFLEITENVPLKYFEQCHSVLAELRKKGSALVIDDFGAGFSNLKYIADLEPDIVKLDRDLIRNCRVGTSGFRLIKSITDLCHQMNARVVAEGIETVDELNAVVTCGVDFGQGYLLARPAAKLPQIKWPSDALRMVEEPPSDEQPAIEAKSGKSADEADDDAKSDREFVLQAEITKLNDFLVQSETARLALVRKLKEYSGPSDKPSSSDDSTDSKHPAPTDPGTSKDAARSSIPRLAFVIPPVLALLVAAWTFWPRSDRHPEKVAAASAKTVEPISGTEPAALEPAVSEDAPAPAEQTSPETSTDPDTSIPAEVPSEALTNSAISTPQTDEKQVALEPSAEPSPEVSATATPDARAVHAAIASRIAGRIGDWTSAWSQQDVDGYLSFYSPEFRSASGQSYRAWSAVRRQKIAASASINVEISKLDFTFPRADRTVATFHQAYSSPGYSDEVVKTLVWALEDGQWRILSESSEPLTN